MKFIIGLGNPGKKYQETRHNVGFMLADILARRLSTKDKTLELKPADKLFESSKRIFADICKVSSGLILAKPQTYMNESGKAVKAVLGYYVNNLNNFSDVFVIHDDLDLELGAYKIQFAKGPKVHNGLLSIYQHLKTEQFWHIRIGVDGRGGNRSIPGDKYVLSKFSKEEKEILLGVFSKIIEKLENSISM